MHAIDKQQRLVTLLSQDANIKSSPVALEKLLKYIELIQKWSKAYNLTAILDAEDIARRHVLDSLSIHPFLKGKRIIDVGSGAGLPGIPLSLINPDKKFVLLDSQGKKTRFLWQVIQELNLNNVEVVKERAELYQPIDCFDSILSRAFTSLKEMLLKTKHLSCKDGLFLAMKGAYPQDELNEIPPGFTVVDVHPLHVAGLLEERHVVCIQIATK
jgi:16S rRNA (guanine527-N7)-methyltransferase